MIQLLKSISARFPMRWQQELKRLYYARQIGMGQFDAGEMEFELLPQLIGHGEWAIDVGANVGTYTVRLAELVGPTGRVIAFEPVPRTFELLASNTALLRYSNVTLINAAVSEKQAVLGMDVPMSANTGLENHYEAHLTDLGSLRVLCLSVDDLQLAARVRLIKIDAEGHELSALKGMAGLLTRDHPTLIIEGHNREVEAFLSALGYTWSELPGSWNRIFRFLA